MDINGQGTRLDKLVLHYARVRAQIEEIKEAHKNQLKPYEEMKSKIAGRMLEFLEATGQESAKTNAGTVYISTRTTASLSDPDAFMDTVIAESMYELLDRKANAKACLDYAKERGTLPPGVKINTIRLIAVKGAHEQENEQ